GGFSMASTPRGSSPSGVASAGRSKRPEPPTIDGTATEVSRSEAKSAESAKPAETAKPAEADAGGPPGRTTAARGAAKNADAPAADVAAETAQPNSAGASDTSAEAPSAASPTTTFEHTETVVPPGDSVPPVPPPDEPALTDLPPREAPERTWPLALT